MNVTFMFTRYSVIFPRSTFTFCSWIQALLMFSSVFSARATPMRTASSKLLVDEDVISVTFATAIVSTLPFVVRRRFPFRLQTLRRPRNGLYSESRCTTPGGHDPSASLALGDATLSARLLRGSLFRSAYFAVSALL